MMERLLVECAVRATVIAVGTEVVVRVGRITAPAVLHRIWTGAVIAMLLLPVWGLWGPMASMPVSMPVLPLPQAAVRIVTAPSQASTSARAPATEGLRQQANGASAARPADWNGREWSWRGLALAIYGLVACALLLRLVFGTLRARRLVRQSVLTAGRLTNAGCASPVTVGWLRPIVILPHGWRDWSPAKLDAVLAHEHAHARRRDPLVQWLALLNRALFWFHPASWWAARRLTESAEQACDEAVLARGHDPQDYSEYLLDMARAVGRGAHANLAGAFMPGTFLPQRIRRLVDDVRPYRLSRTRLACAAAAWSLIAVLGLVSEPARAQQAIDASRMVIRPLQPRWIPPEAPIPQPVSLEWIDGDEWTFEMQSIITSDELAAYGRLETPQQRDGFIERFWATRDPTPETPENEFRAEYTRRVRFARDRFSGSGQAGFGFTTDRGRIYLMFGSPDAIETEEAGGDRQEIWRYDSIADIGQDFRIRFSSSYCGHRIVSPEPLSIAAAGDAAVRMYPFGLTGIDVPFDATKVVGAQYELLNGQGVPADRGQIGSVDDGEPDEPDDVLAEHLPPSWLASGLGCTHALPAGRYTLSTAVRFASGELEREAVTFDVP